MNKIGGKVTLDQLDTWFKVDKKVTPVPTLSASKLEGRLLDPETGQGYVPLDEPFIPRYRRHAREDNPRQTAYAQRYQDLDNAALFQRHELHMLDSDAASVRELECVTDLTSLAGASTVAFPEGTTEEAAVAIYSNYNFKHQYDDKLAITSYKDEIVNTIETNQVTVIQGDTGSGKTTQVAQYILDHYRDQNRYCNIVVTQPRRIATISIAKRVCQERQWQLGSICGYQVGRDASMGEDTRLLYCTTGVLLRKLIKERNMHQFTHVILDEVHERDQESDFCLLVVRKLLRTNSPGVKVVLMSATIDSDMFAAYFCMPRAGRAEPAPVMVVEGRHYDVQEFFLEDLQELGQLPILDPYTPAISEESYKLAAKLIKELDKMEDGQSRRSDGTLRPKGSVLVFLPGLYFINDMDVKLKEIDPDGEHFWICPLHSSIPGEDQARVFEPAPIGRRKVILSTNIAESSITVPDVKYVIDFCLTKSLQCDVETYYTNLQVEWASKANCKQRKGRAGRVSNGRVYRMIPREFYERHLQEFGVPEMQRSRLDQLVLQIKLLNLGEPKSILALALSPPNLDDIERTIIALKEIGALASLRTGEVNPHDGELTFLGQVMAELPCDPPLGRLMMLGHVFGLLEECIIISAALHLKSFFAQPFKAQLNAYKCKLGWAGDTFSDCIAYVIAYQTWERQIEDGRFATYRDEQGWAKQYYLQLRRLKEVKEMVKELKNRLKSFNIQVPYTPQYRKNESDEEKFFLLKLVIAGAFYPNYFEQNICDEENAVKMVAGHNPLQCVELRGLPKDQGQLYQKDIESMFRICLQHPGDFSQRIKVHFERTTTRAIVEFPREIDQGTHQVAQSVYLAVKLKQLQTPLELELLPDDVLEERMSQLAIQGGDESETEASQGIPGQVPLPSANVTVFRLFITEVVNCGHFWAQYEDNLGKMAALQHDINRDQGRHLRHLPPSDLEAGYYCLAQFRDEHSCQFYRARIDLVQFRGQSVKVYFPDYGNIAEVPTQDLRAIEPRFMRLPFQAMECELAGIRPSPIKCSNGKWSIESKTYFSRLVHEEGTFIARIHRENGFRLYGKVYSIVGDVIRLDLTRHDERSGEELDINEALIRKNFAVPAEESFLSKQSKLKRDEELKNRDTNERNLTTLGQGPRPFTAPRQTSGHGRGSSFSRRIKLKGPDCPLEVSFYSMMSIGGLRRVRVEKDSVNSVAFDPCPQNRHARRMMVAGSVSLNPSGSTLLARDTTLLPDIPGMHALMALTFAPCVELRTDPNRTRYIGALCGLGWDSESEGPALPDHDMEITFDVEITNEDISMINQVRAAINLAVKDSSWTFDVVRKIQYMARGKMLSLVQKERKLITETSFSRPHCWRQVCPELLIFPESEQDEHDFLTLICGIELNSSEAEPSAGQAWSAEDHLNQMRAHRDWLHAKAERSRAQVELLCKLCNVMSHSPYELFFHLLTVQHREKEVALL